MQVSSFPATCMVRGRGFRELHEDDGPHQGSGDGGGGNGVAVADSTRDRAVVDLQLIAGADIAGDIGTADGDLAAVTIDICIDGAAREGRDTVGGRDGATEIAVAGQAAALVAGFAGFVPAPAVGL